MTPKIVFLFSREVFSSAAPMLMEEEAGNKYDCKFDDDYEEEEKARRSGRRKRRAPLK